MMAADNRAVEEAMEEVAANKEAADKSTVDEAIVKGAGIGAAEDLPVPGQVPSLVAGSKRAVAPSGSTPPAKRPYKGIWKPRFVQTPPPFLQGFILSKSRFRTVPLPPARPP
jgi:hypothetical protein